MIILQSFLQEYGYSAEEILNKAKYTKSQIEGLDVIRYPERLFDVLSKKIKKDKSLIMVELLEIERSGSVSVVSGDEQLIRVIENHHPYIFITKSYRKERTVLVNSVLAEKDILGLEVGWIGKFNFLGEIIYQSMMKFAGDTEEFKRIKNELARYEVKVHDKSGSLLYHQNSQ